MTLAGALERAADAENAIKSGEVSNGNLTLSKAAIENRRECILDRDHDVLVFGCVAVSCQQIYYALYSAM